MIWHESWVSSEPCSFSQDTWLDVEVQNRRVSWLGILMFLWLPFSAKYLHSTSQHSIATFRLSPEGRLATRDPFRQDRHDHPVRLRSANGARGRPVRPGGLLHGPVLQECLWLSVVQTGWIRQRLVADLVWYWELTPSTGEVGSWERESRKCGLPLQMF